MYALYYTIHTVPGVHQSSLLVVFHTSSIQQVLQYQYQNIVVNTQCTPGPSGQCTPGPSGQCTQGPSGQCTPGPSGQCTPGPSGQCTPGPSGQCTPGPLFLFLILLCK